MPPVGPNSMYQYPLINNNVNVVCESESDYHGIENDHNSVENTFPYLPNIAVVTPTNSFHAAADLIGQSDLGLGLGIIDRHNHAGGEVWPCFECMPPIFTSISSSHLDLLPLKPRRKSPIVRMGNQSFQYIESLHLNNSHDFKTVVHQRDNNQITTAGMASITGFGDQPFSFCDSSTIGDISLSGIDENSIQYDPLDIFLEEMGDVYGGDINAEGL